MSHGGKSMAELPPDRHATHAAKNDLRVDAAGEGCYRTLHRESVDDLIRDLKAQQVHAVLVSVSCASKCAGPSRVARSRVSRVSQPSHFSVSSRLRTPHAVLALGQCGIRRLVDVRQAAGWRELRGALMADTGDAGHRSVLGQLAIDLAGVPDDCWHFFETIFTCSPRLGNVRLLARHLDVTREHADEPILSGPVFPRPSDIWPWHAWFVQHGSSRTPAFPSRTSPIIWTTARHRALDATCAPCCTSRPENSVNGTTVPACSHGSAPI